MFGFFDVLFYVSAYCLNQGGGLKNPEVDAGIFGLIVFFDSLLFSFIYKFADNLGSELLIDLLFVILVMSFIPGFFILYYYMKKKNKGLRIIAKYRQRIKKKRHIVLIWLLYFCIIMPLLCIIIIKI